MAEQNILVTLYFHTVPGTFNGCTVCHSFSQPFLRPAVRAIFRTQKKQEYQEASDHSPRLRKDYSPRFRIDMQN